MIRQPLINYCRQHGVTITPADVNELAIREATEGKWIQIFTDAPPVPYFNNRFLAAPRKKTDVGPVLRVPNKVQFFGLVLSERLMSELRAKQEAEVNSTFFHSFEKKLIQELFISKVSWRNKWCQWDSEAGNFLQVAYYLMAIIPGFPTSYYY